MLVTFSHIRCVILIYAKFCCCFFFMLYIVQENSSSILNLTNFYFHFFSIFVALIQQRLERRVFIFCGVVLYSKISNKNIPMIFIYYYYGFKRIFSTRIIRITHIHIFIEMDFDMVKQILKVDILYDEQRKKWKREKNVYD